MVARIPYEDSYTKISHYHPRHKSKVFLVDRSKQRGHGYEAKNGNYEVIS